MINKPYIGKYTTGLGNASEHLASYDDFFNCRMVGTFNVTLKGAFEAIPSAEVRERWHWFVTVCNQHDEVRYGWVTRDKNSQRPQNVVEILTKAPLPDSFKTGKLTVTTWHPWTQEMAASWAKGQYWFQSWPWTPTQKADSQFVWDHIKDKADWSGKTVLDIGGNAGFHSFRAAHAGAIATVVDPSDATRKQGATIARHIEHQDVVFLPEDPGGEWDVILYLSVHHRINFSYGGLPEALIDLQKRAKDVFVELHTEKSDAEPPVDPFAYWSRDEIDGMFTEKIVTYNHNLRCQRTLYKL